MGGHAEQVVPTLVGIVVFSLVMAFIISSMGVVAPDYSTPDDFDLGYQYDTWTPSYDVDSGDVVTWWQAYRALQFSSPAPISGHFTYAHVVRGNIWYHADSVKPWEMYKDFIQFDFNYISSSGGYGSVFAIPYSLISQTMNTTNDNVTHYNFHLTPVTSGFNSNYTAIIEVDHLANKTADLYANNYVVTLVTPYQVATVGFWTALGYLYTFNADWLPTYTWVAQIISAIIILTVVLCIIRMVW